MQPRFVGDLLVTYRFARSFVGAAVLAALCSTPLLAQSSEKLRYPETRRGDTVDTYHGQAVADPYRWLESLDAPDVAEWVAKQNAVTQAFLAGVPEREQIKARLTKMWDYERFGMPYRRGERYFYSRNDGLQNQSVLFVADSLAAEPRELLDPNKLSKDGTIALSGLSITDDGRLLAYGLSEGGSDWVTYRVRDVATGKDHEDEIRWVKFSGAAWLKDGSGFFYSRYDEPKGNQLAAANYYHKLYFHKLGTPQSQDMLIYDRPDEKEWGFGASVTDDGRYLIINVWQGTERKNRVYYRDLLDPKGEVVKLLDGFDAQYSMIDNDGAIFWFETDLDAPRGRVIAIDTRKPERSAWKEIIPQSEQVLQGVSTVGGVFTATYLKDAHTQIRMFDLAGKPLREVALPGVGSAGGFGGKRSETETFYSYTSFAAPPTIYRYDMTTHNSTVFKQPKVEFDPSAYETTQVFVDAKDGTRVPMFLTHKRGMKLDGSNPVILYGYGGFNVSITPSFSVSNAMWMEMGGVYAVANIRGGGEYGKDWHNAGRLANKQNVFDDFIACAEWLIEHRYTTPARLAILGGSNGGLLVGACMVQRPDLFGAVLPAVGVMDMLRYTETTIGWAWKSDFGDPQDPKMFEVLKAYSPLHNLKPGTHYPATFITTGDHDDRVVPWHSFKFAAALQAAQAGPAPTLIRVEVRAGHGAGKPTAKQIEEAADRFAFLVRVFGMKLPNSASGMAAR
ncbi:MAG: S9 family peptidase [Planctomycetia bacterium]|nr:MAG: S9 family peptidase [Planctomycetia bacterium]